MAYVTLINLYSSLAASKTVKRSPKVDPGLTMPGYKVVQLLPNNELPYVQKTQNPLGVELEDWTVEVYSLCGTLLGDITDSFTCQPFDDDNGIAQIIWKLTNVPVDFGNGLIQLHISQTAGQTFYSTPFQLTNNDWESTTRVDYRNSEFEDMQSSNLRMWYDDTLNADTQNNYEEKATNITRSLTIGRQRPDIYRTELWDKTFWGLVTDVLQSRYVYLDLTRHNLFVVPEIPPRLGQTNFAEGEFQLIPIPTEVYDPLYVPPVIPAPEPGGDVSVVMKVLKQARPGNPPVYRVNFQIPIIQGYSTLLPNFSNAVLNGETVGFTVIGNTTEDTIFILSLGTSLEIVPGQLHVGSFSFRMTDGTLPFNYVYTTPPVIFNASEITNGITKQVVTTIEEV